MCLRLGRAVAPAFPRLRSAKPIACRRETAVKKRTGGSFFSNEKVPPFRTMVCPFPTITSPRVPSQNDDRPFLCGRLLVRLRDLAPCVCVCVVVFLSRWER